MKTLLIWFMLLSPILTLGQSSILFEKHNGILKTACSGGNKGNSTFKTTLGNFEKILLSKSTKKTFENTLPQFIDEPLRVTFSYNEETSNHDLPNYEIKYVLLKAGQIDKSLIVVIGQNIENPIQSINLLRVSSTLADQMIQDAKNKGYLTRESRNTIFNKYYTDKKRKLYLSIQARNDGEGYNIQISKY